MNSIDERGGARLVTAAPRGLLCSFPIAFRVVRGRAIRASLLFGPSFQVRCNRGGGGSNPKYSKDMVKT